MAAIARTEVVLVRPETASNIGAVARVIQNTGLSGLVLVQPGNWRTIDCWRTAWGAQDVLEQAREEPTLASAVADATHVVAFSGRVGECAIDVREAAQEIARLPEVERVCLVFGPESIGLTLQQIAECGRHAVIPSHPRQPSLNLSHAVAVAAYEVFRAAPVPQAGEPLATHAEREAALLLLRQGFADVGLLPATNPDGYFREWTALVQRARLSPREVRLFEHLAHRLHGTVRRPARAEKEPR
jgi:TrmH family RNA methyltransferase